MNEPQNMGQTIGKILVMEEEDPLRKFIKRILTNKGFEVICVKDGAESVMLYKEAKALQRPFDVVILDLTVTFGMGAKKTIKQLIEIDPDVKGIVSTGYIFDDVVNDYKEYGFCGTLTKPFSPSELMTTIKVSLNPLI